MRAEIASKEKEEDERMEKTQKETNENGSVGKKLAKQVWWPEFGPQNLQGKEKWALKVVLWLPHKCPNT